MMVLPASLLVVCAYLVEHLLATLCYISQDKEGQILARRPRPLYKDNLSHLVVFRILVHIHTRLVILCDNN